MQTGKYGSGEFDREKHGLEMTRLQKRQTSLLPDRNKHKWRSMRRRDTSRGTPATASLSCPLGSSVYLFVISQRKQAE